MIEQLQEKIKTSYRVENVSKNSIKVYEKRTGKLSMTITKGFVIFYSSLCFNWDVIEIISEIAKQQIRS